MPSDELKLADGSRYAKYREKIDQIHQRFFEGRITKDEHDQMIIDELKKWQRND